MSELIDKDTASSDIQQVEAASVEIPSYTQRQTLGQLLRGDLSFVPVLLTLIAITVYFTVTTNGLFLNSGNLSNLLQQIITIGIDGLGVSLVLLLGEIDLSVAVVGTLCAVVMGVLSERLGLPAWEAILAALLMGALVGGINGFFVAVLRIPSFIVTLAASIGYAGLLLNLLAGQATLIVHDPSIINIAGSATSFLPDYLGVGLPTLAVVLYALGLLLNQARRRRIGLRTRSVFQLIVQIAVVVLVVEGAVAVLENTPSPTPGIYLGVPNSAAVLFALIVVLWLVLTRTRFGRHIYATGGNAEAARRAGINVVGIRVAAFTLCSMLAAVGGVIAASRENAVATQINPTLLLDAIAAAVIGGVSLFGGRGSVWSIVLGALIIGSLENGLDLKSQGTDVKEMVEGAVLLLAVTIDALVRYGNESLQQLPQQYVRVLARPSVATFTGTAEKAEWNTVWIQLFGLALIAGLVGYLQSLIFPIAVSAIVGSVLLVPISFFIFGGILYLLARAFGGQRKFLAQSHNFLLISLPISILGGLLGLIPIVGLVISAAFSIYAIVLNIFSAMAVHRLSAVKAAAAVLISLVLAGLIIYGLIFFIVSIALHPR